MIAIPVAETAAAAASRRRMTPVAWTVWLVVIGVGLVANLTMQLVGWEATPPPYRPEQSYVTLHAAVPWVFAISAAVGLQLGERRLPLALMVAVVYLWIPQLVFSAISFFGHVWPFVRSVDLVWALLLGMIALCYPRGRFAGRVDWILVGLGVGLSAVRAVTVLFVDTTVAKDCLCSPNAYAVLGDTSTFLIVDLAYRIGGAAIVAVVAGRQFWRWARGSSPARSVAFIMPLGLVAWLLALVAESISFAISIPQNETGHVLVRPPISLEPIAIISLFAVAAIPICYVAGSVHLRNTRGRVADLMSITRDGADRAQWRDELSATLRDPGLEVFWWSDAAGGYRTASGDPIALPVEGDEPTRTLLPIIAGDGSPIAVIRHDRALTENERLLDGVSTALRLTVDNGELRSTVERTLAQVRESRQRIVEAGDEARRRLERDLHDGSQQQLVALAMQLRSVIDGARSGGETRLADELEALLERLTTALRELRELARGIHPTALVAGGLALALPELASRCPVPVTVEVDVPRQTGVPETVEATAWFVAAECLTNVARHSHAGRAWLRARSVEGRLVLTVRDDGRGGADTGDGSGLVGLRDRVEATGGAFRVSSPRGEGTTVEVELPLATAG